MPLKLMVSAAEVSGDVHGAELARALTSIRPDIRLFGLGGERMAAAGVDVRLDITEKSTVGIAEALRHIPSHIKTLRALVGLMKSERPDALIVIDAQGFHMPLAKEAKKLGIRTIYYIAPQEWLWGTERGVKRVARAIDLIVAIFKKEFDAYKRAGGNVIYEGHPVIDLAHPAYSIEEFRSASGVRGDAPFVGFFPGSREQEIKGLLPIMLDAIKTIEAGFGRINPVLGLSSSRFRPLVERAVDGKKVDLSIVEGGTYEILSACSVSVAASGTILLEAAALGAPVIMMYKLSPITAFIARHIVRLDRRISYYAMPNILANKRIVPEFVMGNATAKNISSEIVSFLTDETKASRTRNDLKLLSRELGKPGVVRRVANRLLRFLGT